MPDSLPLELEQFVRDRVIGRVDGFHVQRSKDELVLCGQSRSFYAKQLAQAAAKEFAPQAALSNEIRVVVG